MRASSRGCLNRTPVPGLVENLQRSAWTVSMSPT